MTASPSNLPFCIYEAILLLVRYGVANDFSIGKVDIEG